MAMNGCPVEIIHLIFSFMDPLDVIRLRTVSKQWHHITHDPLLWKTLYANAPLPRPPGPFPFQSTQFLENTLRKSGLVAKSWTTRPIAEFSGTFRIGRPSISSNIIFSKWFLSYDLANQEFMLHDVDSGLLHQVLWKCDKWLHSWDACGVTSREGRRVYILLREKSDGPFQLVEFFLDENSGRLAHIVSLDSPVLESKPNPPTILEGGNAPFLHLSDPDLIFDTRSRIFYLFPGYKSEKSYKAHFILLTSSHIVTFKLVPAETNYHTLIEAFVVPPIPSDDDNGSFRVLHLTHEGIVHKCPIPFDPIRNSVTDSTTGSTNMRCLALTDDGNLRFFCLDLTLPRPRGDTILPISVNIYDLCMVDLISYDPGEGTFFVEASDDGHARGFCAFTIKSRESYILPRPGGYPDFALVKFTIDASGDKCTSTYGDYLHLPEDQLETMACNPATFDGLRGTLYCIEHWGMNGACGIRCLDL